MLVKIVIVLIVIVAVFLISALFIPKNYLVEKSITVNKPSGEVFNYIKLLKNQEHYNKWVMMDPKAKKEFKGTDGSIGFVYAWDSEVKNVGKGIQEIKRIEDGKRMETEIHFIKPFEGIGQTHMTTDSISSNQAKVTWGMKGVHSYPFNFMNLFMDSMLGKDIETSLSTLKIQLEK